MTHFTRKIPIGLFGLLGAFCGQCAGAEEASPDLPSIMELQQLYVEANGGLANIQALSSLVTSGVIKEVGGEGVDFKLYKKRPGMMRLSIDIQDGEILKVFDGKRAFEVFSRRGEEAKVVELDAAETARISLDSSMDGPFFQLRSRPEWLEVVAEVEVEGVPAYEIEIGEEADSPYDRIWLGKENGQEVKLSRHLQSDDGSEVVEEIYFSDFEKVDGVWFARLSRYMRGGELVQSLRIERVRANVGIFDSYFKRPKP